MSGGYFGDMFGNVFDNDPSRKMAAEGILDPDLIRKAHPIKEEHSSVDRARVYLNRCDAYVALIGRICA